MPQCLSMLSSSKISSLKDEEVTNISGIGESTAQKLSKLKINTILDLLQHYPRKYLDFSHPKEVKNLKEKESACLIGEISSINTFYSKSKKTITQATFSDKTGKIKLTWFNNPYIKKIIIPNQKYRLAGKVTFFGNKKTIISPTIEPEDKDSINTNRLVPIYPLTKGITNNWLRKKLYYFTQEHQIQDPLDQSHLPEKLINLDLAYKNIHFPEDKNAHWQADKRLSFNEHLKINLNNELEKLSLGGSIPLKIDSKLHQKVISSLPFQLTPSQIKAIEDIYHDLGDKDATTRLIQGETGSGKTITLIFTAEQTLTNQTSIAIMAPTEILAQQHFKTFSRFFSQPDKVQLVTGKTTTKIKTSTPMVFIGTHALLTQLPESLKFPLSTIAIDEQHKFGVKQRELLQQRKPVPHQLNLSATPIPRTVALGMIGDLEISNITHKPQNRLPITTHIVSPERFKKSPDWITQKLKEGNSLFAVCPHIKDGQNDISSVEKIYKEYQKNYGDQFLVLKIHGKMSTEEQNDTIQKFKDNLSSILVSTSLIEVGIDIPHANIMTIHSAERFGLAQLHQLRGRVGRGENKGYCFLVPSNDDETEIERLKLLQKYDSGLTLAQKDLRLRGAGEIFGIQQHGLNQTRLKYFWSKKLFITSKSLAKNIIKENPKLAKLLLDKLTKI